MGEKEAAELVKLLLRSADLELINENNPTAYKTIEISTLLSVSEETVRRWVRSGKLKAFKLGGKYIRVEKKELRLFIENSKKYSI